MDRRCVRLNMYLVIIIIIIIIGTLKYKKAVLSQGVPRDAAANFGMYRSFQWHRAVFTADSYAFELNNGINHGKIRVFNIIYLLPLNSLFNSHSMPPLKC